MNRKRDLSTGLLSTLGAAPTGERLERIRRSPHADGDRFRNLREVPTLLPGSLTRTVWQQVTGREERRPPGPLPVSVLGRHAFQTPPASGLRVTWLGHSTTLVEIDGFRVLTDPVWAERASPSTLVGARRFHPPPLALDALPPLDAVTISHDHYDHLDQAAIIALARTGVRFFVPLGVGAHLERWGVRPEAITELDWWEDAALTSRGGTLRLAAVPSQHYSGRGLRDGNRTLWASWVLTGPTHRMYVGCDGGLTPTFAEVGRRYGPFDLATLPIGQYGPTWPHIHLLPEEAVEAAGALQVGLVLPIHWGTFALAFHDWREPAEQFVSRAEASG
ncbi:MAG: MBL fold metallo-hydrolase, partial [Gemmatimonadetes bacterium]|nr:MBL fold metallo-hydrolase [Gemmatimonadota bacterium]